MKIDDILKLVNAGYTKDEITAIDATLARNADEKKARNADEKKDEKKDQKTDNSFDYDRFASALVKAQQLANGKTNFGGLNEKPDISKFF